MACVQLLPLCSTPVPATREGMTGANAYGNWIGVGIWFASGQTFSDPHAQGVQDKSRIYTGTVKPNTFTKGFVGSGYAACPA